jgi:membrane-associated phospholipid phosphatase
MNEILLVDKGAWLVAFIASFLIWIMFGGLLVLWLIDGRIKKEQALHAFLSALVAWSIAEMLKNLIPSSRPFELYGYTPLTFTIPADNSFPSSHAAATFAMAGSIWLHDRRLGLVFTVGAVLTAIGRVLANVHYLFDVVTGSGLGIISALVVARLHLGKLIGGKKKA